MNQAQRWVLSISAIITLTENPSALDSDAPGALEILGAAPRPRHAASAMTDLSDLWTVTTAVQLEAELEELLASTDEPGFVLGRAADLVQMGYSAYLLTREGAWSSLVRIARKAQSSFEDFASFAKSYRAGLEVLREGESDEEIDEADGVIARLLSEPRSPWVALQFDTKLDDAQVPADEARTFHVGPHGSRTINEALSQASDGDRIIVLQGTYRERIRVSTPKWDEGEPPSPRSPSVEIVADGRVVLIADDGPVVLVADGGLVLDGVRIDNDRESTDLEDEQAEVVRVIDGFVRLVRCDIRSKSGRGVVVFEAGHLLECAVETSGAPAVLASRLVVMDRTVAAGGGVIVKEEGEAFLDQCHLESTKFSGLEVREHAQATATASRFEKCAGAGVAVFDHGRVRLERCHSTSNTHSGLTVAGGTATAVDSKFVGNLGTGANFEGRSHGSLTRCELRGNSSSAVWLLAKSSVTIAQSTIASHEQGGGLIIRDANAHVSNTTIDGSEVNAVEVYGRARPTFHKCTIRGRGGEGMLVAEGAKPTLSHCTIEGGAQSGVFIQDGEPRLFDCKIHGHDKVGIASEKGGGNVVRCEIRDNKSFGVQAGARLSVRHCKITDNAEDGVYVHEGGDINLEECELARNGDCNVRLFDGHARIVGSRLHHAKSSGVFCEADTKIDVDACDIFDNGEEGIHLYDQSKATIRRSDLHDNKAANLLVQVQASATITDSALDDLRIDGSGRVSLRRTLIRGEITKAKTAKVTQKDCTRDKDGVFQVPSVKKETSEEEEEEHDEEES